MAGRVRVLFTSFIISVAVVLSCCMVVSASDVRAYTTVSDGAVTTVQGICSNANSSIGGVEILSCSSNGRLSFNTARYLELDGDEKEEFMVRALSVTRNSGLGVKTKNQVYNFIAQQDTSTSAAVKFLVENTSADFVEASKWLEPFTSPIATVTGFICLIIFLMLGLSMLIDIFYMAVPFVRLLLERGEERSKPFGVSTEAWKVVREVEGGSGSNSVLSLYLRRRVPVIFAASICLGLFITSRIYDIYIFIANIFN